MSRYAFLLLPSFNRVYASAAPTLARAELEVFGQSAMNGRVTDIEITDIAGVPYITFACDSLSDRDADLLANLSSLYALFEVTETGGTAAAGAGAGSQGTPPLLRPVPARPLDRFDDDLLTILKYQGKTNEQFTKLLLNVTLLSSGFAAEMLTRRFTVLDPLCGRGTTLNQALMYGFDAYGMDIDKRDIETYSAFLQRWLKDKRIKHQAEYIPVRRDKKVIARRLRASFAAGKDDYKAGNLQHLDVVSAEASRAAEFFRSGSADLIVTDAPYGVQHGSKAGADRSGPGTGTGTGTGTGAGAGAGASLTRSPLDLLAECAPAWGRVLRPGGALGISWNTFVAKRDEAAEILADAGLEVLDDGPYPHFRHRVDQAINRDIIVARKPG